MSIENPVSESAPKRLHWVRWPLSLASAGGVAWLVRAMLAAPADGGTGSAQNAFGVCVLLGIATALAWNIERRPG